MLKPENFDVETTDPSGITDCDTKGSEKNLSDHCAS